MILLYQEQISTLSFGIPLAYYNFSDTRIPFKDLKMYVLFVK